MRGSSGVNGRVSVDELAVCTIPEDYVAGAVTSLLEFKNGE